MITEEYQMWFEYDKTKITLPLNPEKITFKDTADIDSVFVGGLGDVLIPIGMKAEQISFSSLFPAHYFNGCTVPAKYLLGSNIYTMFFKACLEHKNIVKFTLTGRNITRYVLVSDFQYTEKGGDVGSYEYSLTLKTYKSAKPRQIDLNTYTGKASVPKQTNTRVNTNSNPQTYTVVYGDCLWNLAKKFYGSGSLYTKIHEANKSLIGPNPNILKVGWVLTIP